MLSGTRACKVGALVSPCQGRMVGDRYDAAIVKTFRGTLCPAISAQQVSGSRLHNKQTSEWRQTKSQNSEFDERDEWTQTTFQKSPNNNPPVLCALFYGGSDRKWKDGWMRGAGN